MPDDLKEKTELLTYNPTYEETELITDGENDFVESKESMESQRGRWRKNEDIYYNNVPVYGNKYATKLKFNLALAVIQTQLPIISDFLPVADVMPQGSNDHFFADMMNSKVHFEQKKVHFRKKSLDCIQDCLIFSNGLVKIMPVFEELEEKEEDGTNKKILKDYEITPVDIYTWFPAVGAIGMDIRKEARYHIFAAPMHLDEIKDKWDNGKYVQSEGYLDEYGQMNIRDKSAKETDKDNYAIVKERYKMDKDKEKYPHGRVTIWANGVLLDDRPQWEDVDAEGIDDYLPPIPYFMVANYRTARNMFGIGEPDLIRTQIKSLNEVMSGIADNIRKSGNPIKKIMREAWGYLQEKMTGLPDENLVVDNMGDIEYLRAEGLPATTFKFLEMLMLLTEIVHGTTDVTGGRKPTGITAASAIIALQEAAQGRVRYKITNEYAPYIIGTGKYFTFLIKTYDDEISEIREESDEGRPEFKEFNPVDEFDNAKLQQMGVDEDFQIKDTSTLKDSKFDIEIVSGQQLPTGKFATNEIAMEKFKIGFYGIKSLLRNSTEKEKDKIYEEFIENQGLAELSKYQEALEKATKEFNGYVEKALNEWEKGEEQGWTDSIDEQEAQGVLIAFPELLNSEAFDMLPLVYQGRLVSAFLNPEEDEEQVEAIAGENAT